MRHDLTLNLTKPDRAQQLDCQACSSPQSSWFGEVAMCGLLLVIFMDDAVLVAVQVHLQLLKGKVTLSPWKTSRFEGQSVRQSVSVPCSPPYAALVQLHGLNRTTFLSEQSIIQHQPSAENWIFTLEDALITRIELCCYKCIKRAYNSL